MGEIKLEIRVLTPIHIGKGKTLDSLDYYVHNNRFYNINLRNALDFILEKYPDAMGKIEEWVEAKSEKLEQAGKAKEKYKLNIKDLIKSIDQAFLPVFEKNLPNLSNYWIPCDEYIGDKQVQECIKTADGKVYIPGSSIKGLIRTALLNDFILTAKENEDEIRKIISSIEEVKDEYFKKPEKQRNLKKFKSSLSEKLQNYVFNCGYEYYDKNSKKKLIGFSDVKYSLMKFIKISDTNCYEPKDVCLVKHPKIITQNNKEQKQLNYYEIIKKNTKFIANLSIDIDYMRMIAMNENRLKNKNNNRIWIDFKEKCNRVFGISEELWEEADNKEIEEIIKNKIFDSLYFFFDKVSNIEFERKPNNFKSIQKYENEINTIFNNNESVPCKLGWGSGFPAMTIFTQFLNGGGLSDKVDEILKLIKDLKIFKFKENRVEFIKEQIKKFPKSRKYLQENNDIFCIGWVEIKFI